MCGVPCQPSLDQLTDRNAGENIAAQSGALTPELAVEWWMNEAALYDWDRPGFTGTLGRPRRPGPCASASASSGGSTLLIEQTQRDISPRSSGKMC